MMRLSGQLKAAREVSFYIRWKRDRGCSYIKVWRLMCDASGIADSEQILRCGEEIMSIIELFMLAVGLSMDAFAVSICKGLSLRNIRAKHMLIAGAWFGGFQALMPTIGYVLGSFFADLVSKWSHWIAFVLLVFIGGSMIKESFSEEEEVNADMSAKVMFLLAIATSIDALAVGVSFAFLKLSTLNIILAVIFIGCITFIFSAVGVKIGSIFGTKYKSKAELVGGIILILIGIKVVLDGLGIM